MSTLNIALENSLFQEDASRMVNLFKNELPIEWDKVSSSYPIPNSKEKGYSSIYVNTYCHTNNNDLTFSTIHPLIKTYADVFQICCKLYTNDDCVGERIYNKKTKKFDDFFTFESFLRTNQRQKLIGAGIFKTLEQNPFKGDHHKTDKFILSLYSRNRKEWVLTDLACQHYNICNTSLYDTLGPTTSAYILDLTESPIVVCSKDKLKMLLEIKKSSKLPFLISIVSMDELEEEDEHYYSLFHEAGAELTDFAHVEKLGESNPIPFRPPAPSDLYTISFTSGTTGPPKGVEITQLQTCAAMTFAMGSLWKAKPTNRKQTYALCFLPLAHIYERMTYLQSLGKGMGIGFPHDGQPTALVENLRILKPNVVTCVPRVYSKFEVAIKDKLEDGGLGLALASSIIKAKEEKHKTKDGEKGHMFLRDKFIISKFQEALGVENAEYLVSGSAPMSEETVRFLRLALNVGFGQGYGLTESFAGISLSYPFDKDPGTVGPIGVTSEMRLREIPEMNYHAHENGQNPTGELLLRGPQIFKKYYKNPELTLELIDDEGWFHTGDVAEIDSRGRLSIVDRVKNFFKLAQGEYITPERIENIYLSQSPALTQLYIHGDSLKNYLIAIAGIDVAHLKKIIKHYRLGTKLLSLKDDELVNVFNTDKNLKKKLIEHLHKGVKDEGLQGFEKFHNIFVAIEPLRVENEVITPTMKIKRNIARKHFENEINNLYEEGSLIKNAKM